MKKERKEKRQQAFIKWLKNPKHIFGIVTLVVILFAICTIFGREEKKHTIETTSTLKKIVKTEKLSTVQYTYNAVAQKKTKDGKVKYYVAYEGIIKAGVEFDEIKIEEDSKKKKITIIVPDVIITETIIDSDSLDFIFTKDKYDTKEVLSEALQLCKDDLEKRAQAEELLLVTARENSISAIKGFFQPWIDSLGEEYEVEFVQEVKNDEKKDK